MPGYRRVEVSNKEEDNLLIGLIVDDKFCKQVLPVVKDDHLKVRQYRHVLRWVREYHEKYSKAPGKQLQTIFDTERTRLNEAEAELIEIFLDVLSKRYSQQEAVNWDYQIDKTRNYLRLRAIEVLADQTVSLAGRGDLDRAEEMVRKFSVVETAGVNWTTPLLDLDLQRRTIDRVYTGLFKMEGMVGDLFGWWQRGWLVAYFGATKRGKSWWLMETAIQAIVAKLRVVFISLEMQDEDMGGRFFSNVSTLPKHGGDYKTPVWDCKKNQDNTCDLDVRTNFKPIPHDGKDNPVWNPDSNYQPCTFCKTSRKFRSHYRLATWFKMIEKPAYAEKMMSRVKAFTMHHPGGNLRMIVYPRDTATFDIIIGALDRMEAFDGFVPDMLVVDYADNMRSTQKGEEWERLDNMWKQLAAIGGERKLLMVTASQGNTKAQDAHTMKGSMTGGTTRKLFHIDVGISLNQYGNEEESMVMRLAPIQGARHSATPTGQLYVLQNLFFGQPYMDSYAPGAGAHVLGAYDVLVDE